MALPKFKNFGEYLYWCYANWQMYWSAFRDGVSSYKSAEYNYYTIRASSFKKLKEGKMQINNLLSNNIAKLDSPDICWYCGASADDVKLTKDHILPTSKGGEDSFDNIFMVCQHCNSSKKDKDVIQWFLENNEYPPYWVLASYMKLVYKYAIEHDLMELHSTDLDVMALPFDWRSLPCYDIPLVYEEE